MKAVIYARVSSREQEETGYSLPSQEQLLKDYAERKDFGIDKKFSITESASGKYHRNTFGEMLKYIENKNIKVIICEKVDRLTRNLRDAVQINEWLNEDNEREVHFVKENCVLSRDSKSNEKFIWNIKVSVAQYYIDNLSEEVKKGQAEKIRQGWLPTKPPLGYKTIGEKGHKIHVINKEKASLIRKMFELYTTGNYSLKMLSEKMFEEGLRTGGGYKLVKSRLANLLSDPFYYGGIRWNKKIYEGKQKPLVEKNTFNRVQQILKSKTTPRYRKHFPLFKGLIHCKECGGLITWEIQKDHWYGHCNHYKDCNQTTWVRQEEIEKQKLPYLGKIVIKSKRLANWIKKALKESHSEEIDYHNKAVEETNRRYEQIQRRLNMLYDDKLDGKIDNNFYEQKFKQYTEEKEAVLEAKQQHGNAQTEYFEMGINILDLSQKAKKVYQKAEKEDRRNLLNIIFSNLYLDDGKIQASYSPAFEILADCVSSSNKFFELAKNRSIKQKTSLTEADFVPLLRG